MGASRGTLDVLRREHGAIWPFVLVGLLVAIGIVAVLSWRVTLPYYAFSPGPAKDVTDLISADVELRPIEGDLYLLTVIPQEVNLIEFIEAYFDPSVDLVEREAVRPADVSREELNRINLDLMEESKKRAIAVALENLGYEVSLTGAGARVEGFVEDTPAAEVLVQGDVIIEIDESPVNLATDAVAIVGARSIGDMISITVLRDEQRVEVTATLVENPTEPGRPLVGVFLSTVTPDFDFPVDVRIDSQNIGGPSAGMMYTLGLISMLGADDVTHGHRIAGTGTINLDGTIGAIGGIRQKVFAAKAAGAEYVLVPAANYEDALDAADGRIEIVRVERIDDALAFLQTLDAAA